MSEFKTECPQVRALLGALKALHEHERPRQDTGDEDNDKEGTAA